MVRVSFIDVKAGCKPLPEQLIKKLSKTIVLFTTSQYYHCIKQWVEQLKKENVKALLLRAPHSFKPGQLTGCGIKRFKEKFDYFLFIGDGLFHVKALLIGNNKKVFTYNPLQESVQVYDREIIEKVLKKKEFAIKKFLQSKNIGVLITTKPGQHLMQNIKNLELLKKAFPEKNYYLFLTDNISVQALQDFPSIECWINTACLRIVEDFYEAGFNKIINLEDLEGFVKKNL